MSHPIGYGSSVRHCGVAVIAMEIDGTAEAVTLDNYNPESSRVHTEGTVTITGLKVHETELDHDDARDAIRPVTIECVSGTCTLPHEDTGSTASNRFRNPGSVAIVLTPGQRVTTSYSKGHDRQVPGAVVG